MKGLLLVLSFISAMAGTIPAAESEMPPPSGGGTVHLVGFLGAGAILNTGGVVELAYGGGLRWINYFRGRTALSISFEYNRRGAEWNLNCLDGKLALIYGTTVFAESGFYVSSILSNSADTTAWEAPPFLDVGCYFALGYQFPFGLTIAGSVSGGFMDLSGDSPYVESLGFVRQLNLHWGGFVSFRLL